MGTRDSITKPVTNPSKLTHLFPLFLAKFSWYSLSIFPHPAQPGEYGYRLSDRDRENITCRLLRSSSLLPHLSLIRSSIKAATVRIVNLATAIPLLIPLRSALLDDALCIVFLGGFSQLESLVENPP